MKYQLPYERTHALLIKLLAEARSTSNVALAHLLVIHIHHVDRMFNVIHLHKKCYSEAKVAALYFGKVFYVQLTS